ncbi:formylglycine-generating enzyme family protein [Pseudarthrobacter sp. So.54]
MSRDRARFTWGNDAETTTAPRANYWHGDFPWRTRRGYGSTTPVGSFPSNGYGLYDMSGSVWEWTSDWYDRHDAGDGCCAPVNPRGGVRDASLDPRQAPVPRKVVKGGSFLCADSYCLRYRPGTNHLQDTPRGITVVVRRTRIPYGNSPTAQRRRAPCFWNAFMTRTSPRPAISLAARPRVRQSWWTPAATSRSTRTWLPKTA